MSNIFMWTIIWVGLSFGLYIYIAWRSRVSDAAGFYIAGKGVPPIANGMATAADWMSAVSFIGLAGLVSFTGYWSSALLMGWTGGYVLLALLLAPYLRKFGKFTVPDFIGDRYYSDTARMVAAACTVFISFTYICGQMRGVGIVFSRFLHVDISIGVIIGMLIVFFYAGLGGMKGITYTQVAQYCVLITAYVVPAVAISMVITGNPIPQLGFGSKIVQEGIYQGQYVLEALNNIAVDLGMKQYTATFSPGGSSMLNIFLLCLTMMCGTAGLPHVIIRFFTTPTVKDARKSAGWALLFIAILYTTCPAVAVFARFNMVNTLNEKTYEGAPSWFKNWEGPGLIVWVDKNNDGKIQYRNGAVFKGKPNLKPSTELGAHGERQVTNAITDTPNELYVDRDIMVLANPEIGGLPAWVIGLVAAGGLAAALSTAAGLLLAIGSSISHDLYFRIINKNASEKQRLLVARVVIGLAVACSGYFGIHPPGFVTQVVAWAFGMAAASFFPAIILGIFSTKTTKEGAICGMAVGMIFTASYIINATYMGGSTWFLNIGTMGIGAIGMFMNFIVATVVSSFTKAPPKEIQELIQSVRIPRGAGGATHA
ncbi:MAG: cation acetate symporter [Proteobacteria bacterium]|nr:cation acetate symporter [Pseudomonadota bacterium]MBU1584240.1 cation acetate symporter [Pseudomonadota bacterium]